MKTPNEPNSVLMMLADGFEEMEFTAPFDIFKRGGLQVVTCAIGDSLQVVSARGLQILADTHFHEVSEPNFSLLFIPGGAAATQKLSAHSSLLDAIARRNARNGMIAAICAGPKVLAVAGILPGRRITCHPDVRQELESAIGTYSDADVVADGNIWTSRGAGTSVGFSFALLSALSSGSVSEEVRRKMVFG